MLKTKAFCLLTSIAFFWSCGQYSKDATAKSALSENNLAISCQLGFKTDLCTKRIVLFTHKLDDNFLCIYRADVYIPDNHIPSILDAKQWMKEAKPISNSISTGEPSYRTKYNSILKRPIEYSSNDSFESIIAMTTDQTTTETSINTYLNNIPNNKFSYQDMTNAIEFYKNQEVISGDLSKQCPGGHPLLSLILK